MTTREIKFNQNYKVKDEEGKEYKEGKTYSMSEPSANHFVMRGLAEKILSVAEKKAEKAAEDAANSLKALEK